jgi:hypothetical protein
VRHGGRFPGRRYSSRNLGSVVNVNGFPNKNICPVELSLCFTTENTCWTGFDHEVHRGMKSSSGQRESAEAQLQVEW